MCVIAISAIGQLTEQTTYTCRRQWQQIYGIFVSKTFIVIKRQKDEVKPISTHLRSMEGIRKAYNSGVQGEY